MLVRVRDFGHTHADLFPESSFAGQMFATVGKTVKQLSEDAVSKMSTKRGGVSTRTRARHELIDRLDTISRIARAIGTGTEGLEDKFELPNRPSDQALLTVGRMFVRDAEAFTSQFIAHDMPQTFLADLAELVERFDRANREREAERDGHIAARASIETALASGIAAVKTLDILVVNRLRDDPVLMVVWKRDRKISYPWRAKGGAAPPAPAPETPTTTPQPTVTPAAGEGRSAAARNRPLMDDEVKETLKRCSR
jgi:hypothetical protein